MTSDSSADVLANLASLSQQLLGRLQSMPLILPSKRDVFLALAERASATQLSALNPPPVTVALLGVTGAGKSSLVNAIIGADLMPWSSAETCTAGIARVRQVKQAGYRVTVQFVNLSSWQEDINRLQSQIEAMSVEAEPDLEGDGRAEPLGLGLSALSAEDKSRLAAVYGKQNLENWVQTRDLTKLELPHAIRYAMQKGEEVLAVDSIVEAKEIVEIYLSTAPKLTSDAGEGDFWPIVQSVLVEGNFPGMSAGAELVDLPGVNDPNRGREQKTREFLASAQFVFVANTGRALLDAGTRSVLQARNVMDRLLAMNVPNVLTLIGTKCDAQIRRTDNVFATYPDRDKATKSQLALFRNDVWRRKFSGEMEELATQLIPSNASREQNERWTEIICQTPIFLTSAQDFQAHEMLASGHQVDDDPVFDSPSQTGIPELREHFKTICLDLGPYSTVRRVVSELEEIINSAVRNLNDELLNTRLSNTQVSEGFKALQKSVQAQGAIVEARVTSISSNQKEWLHQKSEQVKRSVEYSQVSVSSAVNDFKLKLSSLHWMTLRATVANGGVFYSPARGQLIDLHDWVSSSLISNRIAHWAEFFTQEIPEVIQEAASDLSEEAQRFADVLSAQTEAIVDMQELVPLIRDQLQLALASNVALLDDARQAIAGRAKTKSVELISVIQQTVKSQMRASILEAARESGPGMARRMRDSLAGAAATVIPASYAVVAKDLSDLIDHSVSESTAELERACVDLREGVSSFVSLIGGQKPVLQQLDEGAVREEMAELTSLLDQVQRRGVNPTSERSAVPVAMVQGRDYVYIDGSNISVSRSRGQLRADLDILLSCRDAVSKQFPDRVIETFVDGRYRHLLPSADQARFSELCERGVLSDKASGLKGGADNLILAAAARSGAIVVSNDHFRQWVADYPFLRNEGRHLAARQVPGADWLILPMKPNHSNLP